jgi:hypothetical protein
MLIILLEVWFMANRPWFDVADEIGICQRFVKQGGSILTLSRASGVDSPEKESLSVLRAIK